MPLLPLVFSTILPSSNHIFITYCSTNYCISNLPARRKKSLNTWLATVCEELDEEEPPTPEHSHWDAFRLICAAKICEEMRAAVLQQTGFKCSAGIAHNKVQCGVAQV